MLFHNLTSVTEETASSVVSNVEKWHDIFGSIASVVTIDNASTAPCARRCGGVMDGRYSDLETYYACRVARNSTRTPDLHNMQRRKRACLLF
eukprot:XP_001709574.1 Hypothetical protein GL50803_3389 [Giardia lamblia ATCC 50803]